MTRVSAPVAGCGAAGVRPRWWVHRVVRRKLWLPQEPMGAEFEKVWMDNLEKLYRESSPRGEGEDHD